MKPFSIIEAPSPLGLWPSGVQDLARVLLEMGLGTGLGARHAERLAPLPYDPRRCPDTHLLNPQGIADYSLLLAGAVETGIGRGEFPIVLGGDCSVLLGPALALKRRGRHGLLFIDGHMDFWDAKTEPRGEAASMDLALVTGHGPAIVSNIGGLLPYFQASDVAAVGARDHLHDPDFVETPMPRELRRFDLLELRKAGITDVARESLSIVGRNDLEGFWIHFDVDALDDRIMPAVDYRMANGLSWDEFESLLSSAMATGRAIGLNVTIYNPNLDPARTAARDLVHRLIRALTSS